MKNTIFSLLLIAAVTSCKKEDQVDHPRNMDATITRSINVKKVNTFDVVRYEEKKIRAYGVPTNLGMALTFNTLGSDLIELNVVDPSKVKEGYVGHYTLQSNDLSNGDTHVRYTYRTYNQNGMVNFSTARQSNDHKIEGQLDITEYNKDKGWMSGYYKIVFKKTSDPRKVATTNEADESEVVIESSFKNIPFGIH